MKDLLSTMDTIQQLNFLIWGMGVLSFCFFVSSLTVLSNDNVGFTTVLTSLFNMSHTYGSWYIIHRTSCTPLSIGFLIGVSFALVFISMITAVYWTSLSHFCIRYDLSEVYTSCDRMSSIKAIFFLEWAHFVSSALFTCLILFRREKISLDPDTDGFFGNSRTAIMMPQLAGFHDGLGVQIVDNSQLHTISTL